MIEKVLELVKKYKEMILYLIFGGLTTLINILVYELFSKAFDVQYLVSNGIAWVIAVLFAFVTNRLYVFESRSRDPKVIGRQFVSFIGSPPFHWTAGHAAHVLSLSTWSTGTTLWSRSGQM